MTNGLPGLGKMGVGCLLALAGVCAPSWAGAVAPEQVPLEALPAVGYASRLPWQALKPPAVSSWQAAAQPFAILDALRGRGWPLSVDKKALSDMEAAAPQIAQDVTQLESALAALRGTAWGRGFEWSQWSGLIEAQDAIQAAHQLDVHRLEATGSIGIGSAYREWLTDLRADEVRWAFDPNLPQHVWLSAAVSEAEPTRAVQWGSIWVEANAVRHWLAQCWRYVEPWPIGGTPAAAPLSGVEALPPTLWHSHMAMLLGELDQAVVIRWRQSGESRWGVLVGFEATYAAVDSELGTVDPQEQGAAPTQWVELFATRLGMDPTPFVEALGRDVVEIMDVKVTAWVSAVDTGDVPGNGLGFDALPDALRQAAGGEAKAATSLIQQHWHYQLAVDPVSGALRGDGTWLADSKLGDDVEVTAAWVPGPTPWPRGAESAYQGAPVATDCQFARTWTTWANGVAGAIAPVFTRPEDAGGVEGPSNDVLLLAASQTAEGLPRAIEDFAPGQPTEASVEIGYPGVVDVVEVRAKLTHPYPPDLVVSLEGPAPFAEDSGCAAREVGGCDECACEACVCGGDSYCCEVGWDQTCALACVDDCGGCETGRLEIPLIVDAPAGTFEPWQQAWWIPEFAGAPAQGVWTLRVADTSANDAGSLDSFRLDLYVSPLELPSEDDSGSEDTGSEDAAP